MLLSRPPQDPVGQKYPFWKNENKKPWSDDSSLWMAGLVSCILQDLTNATAKGHRATRWCDQMHKEKLKLSTQWKEFLWISLIWLPKQIKRIHYSFKQKKGCNCCKSSPKNAGLYRPRLTRFHALLTLFALLHQINQGGLLPQQHRTCWTGNAFHQELNCSVLSDSTKTE